MSTRAMYSFTDRRETLHVYKHHDGYPSGACQWIAAALPYAWPLPRFEADEFAAAFVAGNKSYDGQPSSGGVRLMQSGEWQSVAPGDLDYRYEISEKDGKLEVAAYDLSLGGGVYNETLLFVGSLDAFTAWARKKAA